MLRLTEEFFQQRKFEKFPLDLSLLYSRRLLHLNQMIVDRGLLLHLKV